ESDRPVSYLMRLAPNDRVTERVDVRVQGRGVHDLGPIWLRTADPLGFKIVRSRMPTEDRIVGLPALVPLERLLGRQERSLGWETEGGTGSGGLSAGWTDGDLIHQRSEEHTSELQSREKLVCRLLLEKKKHTNMLS